MKYTYLFTLKYCGDCHTRHHFDRENEWVCVNMIVRFDKRIREERAIEMNRRNEQFIRDVMTAENIRPRAEVERRRLLGALEKMSPNKRTLYEALHLPLSTPS